MKAIEGDLIVGEAAIQPDGFTSSPYHPARGHHPGRDRSHEAE